MIGLSIQYAVIETLEFRITVAGGGNQADIHHLLSRNSNQAYCLHSFRSGKTDDPG